MENLEVYTEKAIELILSYGPKLILAIITLLVGLWVIRIAGRGMKRLMQKKNLDPSLSAFLKTLVDAALKVMLVISVMGMVGIEMTSFIAVLGAAGLAVGMALSGTLQNFAGGALILILKPFKAGDYIDAQGYQGTVKEIQIFNTILVTPDNKRVIIPNGGLSTSSMINYSHESQRRIDMTFGIGYEDDIDKAKGLIKEMVDKDSRILKDPEPFIAVSELADSSVNLVVRPWVNSGDYWGVYFDMQENVKKEFDKQGISIPFPQTDVHHYTMES